MVRRNSSKLKVFGRSMAAGLVILTGFSCTSLTGTGCPPSGGSTPNPTPTSVPPDHSILPTPGQTGGVPAGSGLGWSWRQNGNILEIGYGSGVNYPQFAALDLTSGYFRMNYGPASGWGTSVILPPAFWSSGYHQGAPVSYSVQINGTDLVVNIGGSLAGLSFQGAVRISPPQANRLTAQVQMTVGGSVTLDNRPSEAFKPVMLSSMHISDTAWDAQSAFIGGQTLAIPAGGWLVPTPISDSRFGLTGGTSTWKTNAPTITAVMDNSYPITGWITPSSDPNSDNVGLWAASNTVLSAWSYTISASQ